MFRFKFSVMALVFLGFNIVHAATVEMDAEWGDHGYKVFKDRLTWYQAAGRCRRLGGYLATVKSAEENALVASLVTGDSWIGGSDSREEGNWRWVSGESFSFQNWSLGEPNNAQAAENASEMRTDGKWNDLSGDHRLPCVCEWGSP